MRRSTVLSLLPQLEFPACAINVLLALALASAIALASVINYARK
jgi:hypothetical protein